MSTLLLLLSRQDEKALHVLVLGRGAIADRIMQTVTHLGDAWLVIGVCLLLLLSPDSRIEETGWIASFTVVVSHLAVQLLKRSIDRPRPQLPTGAAVLIDPPDRFSFPSGHAAASLSLALPLTALLPFPVASLAVAIAAMVGLSRCYLGVHYPGDVVVGWLLATLAWYPAAGALAALR